MAADSRRNRIAKIVADLEQMYATEVDELLHSVGSPPIDRAGWPQHSKPYMRWDTVRHLDRLTDHQIDQLSHALGH